jgi:hypothetical protein
VTARAGEGITISGGDLPYPVRLAPADEDAFKRRINSPPRLDNRPERAAGPTYTLASGYWGEILARPNRPPIEENATYYPEGGMVRARYGGEDAWLSLDLRQQGILERYIRLGRARAIPQRPGLLSLLTAAQREEDLAIEAGGAALPPDKVGSLWAALATAGSPRFLEPPEPIRVAEKGLWLVFNLQEGRSLQLYFDPGSPATLTDALGSERYTVSPALASVLSTIKPAAVPLGDQTSPGSKAWWVIMAGVGLACLVAAVWLARHPLRLPFEPRG